jgi:flagellar basal-body rod modification protein FlgD
MSTTPIGSTAPGGQSQTDIASIPKNGELGRDAFLRLLTTQLQHQDPTAPQANGEFIAQLATFSSLEQLQQIEQTLSGIDTRLQAAESAVATQTKAA